MLERGELNNVCILLSTEQQLNQTEDKSSHFSSFFNRSNCCVSVVLLLDKGDYPDKFGDLVSVS